MKRLERGDREQDRAVSGTHYAGDLHRTWPRTYDGHIDFYLDYYGQHVAEQRTIGSFGAGLIEGRQSSGDWSDAPSPDLVIAWLASEPVTYSFDLGAGNFHGRQKTGDAIVIAPQSGTAILIGEAHRVRVLAIPYQRLFAFLGESAACLPRDGDFGPLHTCLLREPGMRMLLDRLWRETRRSMALGAIYEDGAVLQLIGLLMRAAALPRRPARGGLAGWQLRRLIELLQADLAANIGLNELAASVNYSPAHLCRAFKANTGQPPHAWLLARRVEHASKLLAETEQPIGEVAASVGYDDPSYFARLFRRGTGVTPRQYRLQSRM